MAKTESPVPDAVDPTTPDVTMAEPEPIKSSEELPIEPSSQTSAPEPTIASEPLPIDEPTIEATADLVTDAEALPPTTVVTVPTEEMEEDVPMAEVKVDVPQPTTPEETNVTSADEPKLPVVEKIIDQPVDELKVTIVEDEKVASPEEEPVVAMDETPELTDQIKKTDSDAGDEPKIVDVDVNSMDVDMADVASAVNGSDTEAVVGELAETETALIEAVEEAAVGVTVEQVEQVAVTNDMILKDVETAKPKTEEVDIPVDVMPAVDSIVEKEQLEKLETELKPIEPTENVVDEIMEEAGVESDPTEKTDMDITETDKSATQNAQEEEIKEHSDDAAALVAAVTEPNPVDQEMNGIVEAPIIADSQTLPPSERKITNGNAETTTAEVAIPIIVEQSSVTDSTTPSPAILSTSSETNELTEITSSESPTGKEKVSRVEITIEQIEKLPGQTTQTTTTHIVKEIVIKEQQHVSPTKSMESAEADTAKDTTEPLNGQQTNGNTVVEHSLTTNGKELLMAVDDNNDEVEKNGDDSDKENEVSTTNGSDAAAATAESEHLAEVVLKKQQATDSLKPIETVPDVTA